MDDPVLCRFQTRKVRSWRSAYKRIFCLSRSACLTVDPSNLTVTNVYPYSGLTKVEPSPSDAEEFVLEADGSGLLRFKCRWRAELLTELTRLQTLASFDASGWHGSPYAHAAVAAQRLRRGGGRCGCLLVAAPHALVELSHEWTVLQEYKYLHIEALSYTEDDPHALTVRHTGRNRVFMCQGRETLLKAARANSAAIGVHLDVSPPRRLDQVRKEKAAYHSCAQRPAPAASFRVDKPSRRRGGAMAPRKLEVRDAWLVEMDAASYAVVWARRLLDVFALVRSNENSRELCIEFMDGMSRSYLCAERDALLACILDAALTSGNERVMLSTGVSDTLRLLPRHVTEQQAAAEDAMPAHIPTGAGAAAAAAAAAAAGASSAANLYQSVFGNVTVELWCLRRLGKAATAAMAASAGAAVPATQATDADSLLAAAAEFNANVEVTGIARGTEAKAVKPAMVGLVAALAALSGDMARASPQARSALYVDASTLLQSLCRVLPAVHAFQGFVEACGAEGFSTLVRLLCCSDGLVAFWTLRALRLLVTCPFRPANLRAEFVNKQVLLGPKPVCESLAALLRQPDDVDEPESSSEAAESSGVKEGEASTGADTATPAAATSVEHGLLGATLAPGGGDAAAIAEQRNGFAAAAAAAAATTSASAGSSKEQRQGGAASAEQPRKRIASGANASVLAGELHQAQGVLVVMAASELLESVLVARRETTSPGVFNQVLSVVGRRHAVLMDMLRSPCGRVVENGILLMQVLAENAPQAARSLQDMALSQALVLRHFHHACFSPSKYQRFISRWLCALWMSSYAAGTSSCSKSKDSSSSNGLVVPVVSSASSGGAPSAAAEADGAAGTATAAAPSASAVAAAATPSTPVTSPGKELLTRLVPSGMLQYLRMPTLSPAELQCLDDLEDEMFARGGAVGSGGGSVGTAKGAEKAAGPRFVMAPRLGQASRPGLTAPNSPPPLQLAPAQGSGQLSLPGSADGAPAAFGDSGGVTGPPAASAAAAAAAAAAAGQGGGGSVAAAAGTAGGENFRVLFHMLLQDQSLPDLIWNQETRQELRVQVEEGLRGFERQQQLRGVGAVAWNAADFRVDYASLRGEPAVGGMSLSRFLEASDAFLLSSVAESARFADLLFRRVLCEWQENAPLARQCLQCFDRLYRLQSASIGPFEDVPVLVSMIRQSIDVETQHRLLQLLSTLCATCPANLAPLLEPNATFLLTDLAAQAHWAEETAGNVLARHMQRSRGGGASLYVTSGGEGAHASQSHSKRPSSDTASASGGVNGTSKGSTAGAAAAAAAQASVPDAECPRLWHYAAAAPCPPPGDAVMGPVLLSRLREMYSAGELSERTLVAAGEVVGDYETTAPPPPGGEGGSSDGNIVVDTGRWRPLGEVFQLRCAVMSVGRRVLSPAEAALLAMGMLRRLVAVQPSMDSQGVPYWPLPRGKRLLGTPQTLATLATLLLSPHANVAAAAAALLEDVCAHNLPAVEKLYTTGAFFFALLQPGSNAGAMASLLAATHLRQQHLVSGAAVAEGLPLRERSFLGHMLPEAMITILHRYGPHKFAEVFIGDYDTPEVIWNSAMRQHLCEMLSQHIGDFPLRLRQQPSAPYQYCPLPSIKYRALEGETYLRGYYLRGLCDTWRFPDWPVSEPAAVLRAVVEAWQEAMARRAAAAAAEDQESSGGSGNGAANGARGLGLTPTLAAAALGVERGCDGAELRRAYRSLARRYHPDKNPQGRDQFVRVQEAYELLLELEASGGGGGGKNSGGFGGGGSGNAEAVVMTKVLQLMAVQVALCRRYTEQLRSYKYPAYQLALQVVAMSREDGLREASPANGKVTHATAASLHVDSDGSGDESDGASVGSKGTAATPASGAAVAAKLLQGSMELVSVTCALNELNAEEFARCGGCAPLLSELSGLVDTALAPSPPPAAGGAAKRFRHTLEAVTHTIAVMSRLQDCRGALAAADQAAPCRLAENLACLLGVGKFRKPAAQHGEAAGPEEGSANDASGDGGEGGESTALVVVAAVDEGEAAAAGTAGVARLAAVPLVATQHCLQAICGLCKHEEMGRALAAAGIVWRLIPLMLRFDASLETAAAAPSGQVSRAQTQHASNATAAMATWSLGCLGGYTLDEMATPPREDVRAAASALLTPQLAKLLRNRDSRELLTCLNSTVQRATRLWLPAMRHELEICVAERMRRRGGGKPRFSDENELAEVAGAFEFKALRGEQQVAGVYLRLFNADPDGSIPELESGDVFCAALVDQMRSMMPEAEILSSSAAIAAAMGASGREIDLNSGTGSTGSSDSESGWWGAPRFLACLRALRHLLLHPVKGPACMSVLTDVKKQAKKADTHSRSSSSASDSDRLASAASKSSAVPGSLALEKEESRRSEGPSQDDENGGGGRLEVLFRLLETPPQSAAFGLACEVLEFHAASEAFAEAVVAQGQLGRLVRLLAVKPATQRSDGADDGAGPRWRLLDSLCASPVTAVELLRTGAPVLFVGMLAAAPPLVAAFADRVGAAGTLRRLSWDPMVGPAVLATLSAFLPEALVQALQQEPAQALALFDADHELPELIWTAEMRAELRAALRSFVAQLLGPGSFDGNGGGNGNGAVLHDFALPPGFRVRYRALEAEIFLGGVYLRLFLQTPTHDIRQPEVFLEKLMDAWLSECNAVFPATSRGWGSSNNSTGLGSSTTRAQSSGGSSGDGGSSALTLGREDLLTLYTSAVVFVLKRRGGLATRFVEWGFVPRVLELLRRSVDIGFRGTPQVSCVRILHELAPWRPAAEAMVAADEGVLWLLMRCLGPPLPKDAAFVVECAKRLVVLTPEPRGFEAMVSVALNAGFVGFMVTEVLESPDLLASGKIVDPSATKVHAVELLKALACHPMLAERVAEELDALPAWRKYKHQDHDLFINSETKTDYFLTADTEALGRKLLTAAASSASSSQTPPPPPSQMPEQQQPLAPQQWPPNEAPARSAFAAPPAQTSVTDVTEELVSPFGAAPPASIAREAFGSTAAAAAAAAGTVNQRSDARGGGAADLTRKFGLDAPAGADLGPLWGGSGGGGGSAASHSRSASGASNGSGGGPGGGGPGSALQVTVVKDLLTGLGIDVRREGEAMVVKAVKPEARFMGNRKLQEGDVIAGVNGVVCETFAKGVRLLKAAEGDITLLVSRHRAGR